MWYQTSTADYAPRAPAPANPANTNTHADAATGKNVSESVPSKNAILGLCTVALLGCAYFFTDRSETTVAKADFESAAPTPAQSFSEDAVMAYINRFVTVAQKEQELFAIPASISLAQGIVESRAGQSKLAIKNKNHFGLKCFQKNCKTGHCSNHTDDTHKDFFKIFNSDWDSWRAHSKLLKQPRYAKFSEYGTDYKKWAYGLQKAGYATHKKYAEMLIGVIEKYELYQYD